MILFIIIILACALIDMNDKAVMRCIERLFDKKNHKFYFKLRKMRSMDVPDGSFVFFGDSRDCKKGEESLLLGEYFCLGHSP